MRGWLGDLSDLVLPTSCVGCGAERVPLRYSTCVDCVAVLHGLTPSGTCPVPEPPAMPFCVAMGPYADVLRATLLAYKERDRHRLARPLGALLATAVAEVAVRGGADSRVPLLVVPVPSTARAARARRGDHLARLAAHAVRRLTAAGWRARVLRPLRVVPRPDSASLGPDARAAAAVSSLRIRATRLGDVRRAVAGGGMLVVVDDIVTTGATLAAATQLLGRENLQVAGAAVLAATQLRRTRATGSPGLPPRGADWANRRESVPRTRGDGRPSAR